MNLLRIQDALKNASDQQLMQLMQAPDSTAPSSLVLSEIRRRKDMRAQQAPEGQPDRTVAEELTAPEGQGIRGMQMPEEPPQEASPQSGIEAMREGGVVRMQIGGQPPSPYISETTGIEYPFTTGSQDPVIFGRPLHTYSLEELQRLRADERAAVNLLTGPRSDRPALPMGAIESRIATLRGRAQPRFQESPALDENVPSLEGIGEGIASREFAKRIYESSSSLPVFRGEEGGPPTAERPTPTTTTTAQPGDQQRPPAAQPPVAQPPAAQPPVAQQSPRPAAPQPPRPAQPAAPAAQPAQGIGALRPTGTQGDEPAQSSVQFTDRLSPLFERMREGRVDASARRNEALNMAMIEAGLRIASSRNPSLAGALGEGAAPAVQSYSQQLGQIRADQRQDLRDELQGALAQNQNDYYRGLLSQQEFATRQQMIIERLRQDREDNRTGLREAGANFRNAATIAGQRDPANVAELRYLEDLRVNNPPAFEAAMRARQTGVGAAEVRGSVAMARAVQEAVSSDPGLRTLSFQRNSLERLPNRTEAQNQELASIRSRIAAAEQAIEQRILRFSSQAGGLPVSSTPTGPGPVVQAPPR